MGIPGFFSYIQRKYPNVVVEEKKISKRPYTLYFDANGAIYTAVTAAKKSIPQKPGTNWEEKLEKEIIRIYLDYVTQIINKVNPTDYVCIYIDGIAPRAKMEQQRERRFKGAVEQDDINGIKEDLKVNEFPNKWSTVALSPGTEFMLRLNNAIRKYFMDN